MSHSFTHKYSTTNQATLNPHKKHSLNGVWPAFLSIIYRWQAQNSARTRTFLHCRQPHRKPRAKMTLSTATGLLIIFFFVFLSSLTKTHLLLAQSTSIFACDVENNPLLGALGFCNMSMEIDDRVDDLVTRLSLEEKIGFLVNSAGSVSRLGIPRYQWWSEALHGVSYLGPGTHFSSLVPGATSFPQVILTAASFNITLFEAIGKAVSSEARAMYNEGLAGLTFWSPNVNIFRDPRWGRGQETPGEDPLLSSKYGSSYVRGLQRRDDGDPIRLKVAACCKHYTAYDLERWRDADRYHFNAVVNQQDLDDTFQPPFKSCVTDGNVASVMCSYNQVNGKPTCVDRDLLVGTIRAEWKLNGYIVSDCDSLKELFNSQHYTKTPEEAAAEAILAGLDLNCGSFLGRYTESAIKAQLINESSIDNALSNSFATLMRLGFFDGDPRRQIYGNLGKNDVCTEKNRELAREAARQGIVLLKNSPGSLPLSRKSIKSMAVIGPNANATKTMIGNYEGTPCNYTTPLQGLSDIVETQYHPGCSSIQCSNPMLDDSKKIAAVADVVVLVMGADQSIERESLDRNDLLLPGKQQDLVAEVAEVSNGPVILLVMSGGGIDVEFAKANDKITSIIWIGYPGEAGGAAIADIIFGDYNPSGRLPITWYRQSYLANVPMTDMNMRPNPYTGYPGRTYRFYTGEVVYPFGVGLSYSQYQHQLIQAPQLLQIPLEEDHLCHTSECVSLIANKRTCRDLVFDLKLKVKNSGFMSGSHTVLFFSTPPAAHNSPKKKLMGFKKVFLKAHTETKMKFRVDVCKDLSVVDEAGYHRVAFGKHVLHVGSLRHSLTITI